jgi:antitoxin component YwqK of YwqJK toxin-antitoxin module
MKKKMELFRSTGLILLLILIGSLTVSVNKKEIVKEQCQVKNGMVYTHNNPYSGLVKIQSKRGKIECIYKVTCGIKHGDYIEFYSDGITKKSVTKFQRGRKIMVLKYDRSGKEL